MLTWEYRSMVAMGKPISLGPSPSEIADFIHKPPGRRRFDPSVGRSTQLNGWTAASTLPLYNLITHP
jgi:hypothetical protein